MTTFHLAQDHAGDLNTLIDTRLLVQANSGGGKSWVLRRLLEQTHGRVQHLVIDPEGEFASLRERFDYILAARHGGDTAADPRAARLLAERLLELGVSAILDIYELKAHERIRFVRQFLEALVDAPKKLWHPALVVVDEAHIYCPQQGEAESAAAVIDLATRGRKRGYCAVLATQRLAKLHKDAAAELNNKLIGRTGLDVDVKRAADELGFGKERWRDLRDLEAGHFFAFGPALSRSVVAMRIGPVQTTHPKAGARLAFTAPPATAKIKALLPKLADLPAEVEERQKTVEDLRRETAQLKRELTEARRAQPATPPPKRVEVPVLKDAQLARLEKAQGSFFEIANRVGQVLERFTALGAEARAVATEISGALRVRQAPPSMLPHAPASLRMPQPVATTARAARRPPATSAAAALPAGERAVLTAIAQHGDDGVTREQLSVLTGYKRSTRDAYLQRAGERGHISVTGDRIIATQAGVDALGADFEPLPTGEQLRKHWLARLPDGERRVLEVLVAAYPEAVDREAISDATGYKRSTRDSYLQRLGARRLVVADRGRVRASEMLFG